MKRLLYYGILICVVTACETDRNKDSKYLRWVGDIVQNAELDRSDFTVCNEKTAMQYFNFGEGLPYVGEHYAIEKEFMEKYDPDLAAKESGLIRIRFLVNCEGESGRFRLTAMDFNYNEKSFDSSITRQLMRITKELKNWKIMPDPDFPKDYYQYLIFKIQAGQIVEIIP